MTVKISALPAATAPDLSTNSLMLEVSQGVAGGSTWTSKQLTGAQLKTFVGAGTQGPTGTAATLNVGSVTTTTGAAGSAAAVTVSNVGSSSAATFAFTFAIPTGPTGASPTFSIGTVSAGTAAVTLTGTSLAPVLNFVVPSGTSLVSRGAWSSGTIYSAGNYVFDTGSSSTSSMWIYSGTTSYTSTTAPRLDLTHWSELVGASAAFPTQTGNAGKFLITDGTTPTWSLIDLSGTSVSLSGALTYDHGGTGMSTAGTSGNVLTSNGTSWLSSPPGMTKIRGVSYSMIFGG
ncbi:hypothetical protein UFOVP58_147 [uncultured Caudovirales phage]|uniref:Uncharacterized protein n=1 Tax=uncultured Caudovirales phage TaxID=2100421 RepID=A0A6J5KU55_9CAUD|nr:hypothetical protein UFOVP58_147 [uncultured Caudovirales phage]